VNSIYDYIIEPLGERYNNSKKIGNKELILNTSIETFKAVNKKAKVVAVPKAYDLPIKKGDIVYVHHNVFRKFYNMKGKQQNSRSYFKDGLYFCGADQIYLYERKNKRHSFLDRCFVQPIISETLGEKARKNIGILKYGNKTLQDLNVNEGDLVSFPSLREWEFVIDGKLLYCMKSKDILINHGHKGNEKEYNPSWAKSSKRAYQSS
jgi:co-chaperonin GroES (HSP10)